MPHSPTLTAHPVKTGKKIAAVFHYRPDDRTVQPYIKRFARHYGELQAFFGVSPQPLEIRFIYTRAEMSRHWGKPAPRWLSGMVDNDNPYCIYVYSPAVIGTLTDETRRVIMPTIVHEAAHAFVTKLNERCYYWINEGICQVLEGKTLKDSPIAQKHWRWFVQKNGLTDPGLGWRETIGHDGYAIAHRLAAYLLKTRGQKAIISLVKIRRIPDPLIGKKLERSLGVPIAEFLQEFEKTIVRQW